MTGAPDDPSSAAPDDGIVRRLRREGGSVEIAEPDSATPAPDPDDVARSQARNLLEWIAVICGAVLIAVVVRTVFLQTFWIPSPSMSPTLVRNDRVLVNKLSYRFHDINRGDVVVFERPTTEQPSEIKDLIKRVVGLPGERVSIVDGKVSIDGRELTEPYVHGLQTTYDGSCAVVDMPGLGTEAGYEIPKGRIFVMGDNRINSHDGRCFGPISESLVVGRAFFILWPPGHAGGL